MDKLINIVGILRSYVNRCAKCDTGSPCESQITFDDFIDQVDSFAHDAEMPANTDELLLTLTQFEQFLSRLKRMPKSAQAGFVDEHFHFTGNKARITDILRIFER